MSVLLYGSLKILNLFLHIVKDFFFPKMDSLLMQVLLQQGHEAIQVGNAPGDEGPLPWISFMFSNLGYFFFFLLTTYILLGIFF